MDNDILNRTFQNMSSSHHTTPNNKRSRALSLSNQFNLTFTQKKKGMYSQEKQNYDSAYNPYSTAYEGIQNSSSKQPLLFKKLVTSRPSSSLAEQNLVKNFNKNQPNTNLMFQNNIPSNQPQRIELPLFFNTPVRFQTVKKQTTRLNNSDFKVSSKFLNDQEPFMSAGLDKTFSSNMNKSNEFSNSMNKDAHNATFCVDKQADPTIHIYAKRRIQDYKMLAFACKRAGKTRDEGRAYYSIGVLFDNMGKYEKAIENYEAFLNVCQSIGDVHGEALAYNCIGVDYQILGEDDPTKLDLALQYHSMHENIADLNGKFLAAVNMGLCYDQKGQSALARFHFQQALQISIKMCSLVGQSIAVGNIGKIGASGLRDNQEKMKIFVDKYMKLAEDLKDKQSIMKGHIKMGNITAYQGDFEEGRDNFLKALELAKSEGDTQMKTVAQCGFAISNAENDMNYYLQSYVQQMKMTSTTKI